jgi:hypothetical protein
MSWVTCDPGHASRFRAEGPTGKAKKIVCFFTCPTGADLHVLGPGSRVTQDMQALSQPRARIKKLKKTDHFARFVLKADLHVLGHA